MEQLNIFETVKQSVSLRHAASFYGIHVQRNGKTACPFHADVDPSLQLYEDHYYCYGCGAHGDVTDFMAGIFHLTPLEAARKLAADSHIRMVPASRPSHYPSSSFHAAPKRSDHRHLKIQRIHAVQQLLSDLDNVTALKEKEAPSSPDEEFPDSYLKLIRAETTIMQMIDTLLFGTASEQEFFSIRTHEGGEHDSCIIRQQIITAMRMTSQE